MIQATYRLADGTETTVEFTNARGVSAYGWAGNYVHENPGATLVRIVDGGTVTFGA